MKAIKYQILVQDDPVHTYNQRIIDEVYIPHYDIYFNSEKYVFRLERSLDVRYKNLPMKEIEIDENLAALIFVFENCQNTTENAIANFFCQ